MTYNDRLNFSLPQFEYFVHPMRTHILYMRFLLMYWTYRCYIGRSRLWMNALVHNDSIYHISHLLTEWRTEATVDRTTIHDYLLLVNHIRALYIWMNIKSIGLKLNESAICRLNNIRLVFSTLCETIWINHRSMTMIPYTFFLLDSYITISRQSPQLHTNSIF